MVLDIGGNVFDLLAVLCGLLSKEDERECAIRWLTAEEEQIKKILNQYKTFQEVVLKAAVNEYKFSEGEIAYLNSELKWMEQSVDLVRYDIYLLVIKIENVLEEYNSWQNNNVIYRLSALNSNVEECGIAIYPRVRPQWNTAKSERNRERNLNAKFENYMMIRTEEMKPFEITIHYWNDKGILKPCKNGWTLPIALSPIMDFADLHTVSSKTEEGKVIHVEGLKNAEVVTDRVVQIFDILFPKGYSVIVFPEALGTEEILITIKNKMRMHPEYCTFVLLPTICKNGRNSLIVLGPGGIEVLKHEKATPFVLVDKEGNEEREALEYKKEIHLLMTKELGLVAFTICAELLEPRFYNILTNVAMVDTIICPSFSPGIKAFKETMLKGVPLKLLQVYINTCSAKAVSRNGQVAEMLGMIQVPYMNKEIPVESLERNCGGECAETVCYFDVVVVHRNHQFMVERRHCPCA